MVEEERKFETYSPLSAQGILFLVMVSAPDDLYNCFLSKFIQFATRDFGCFNIVILSLK